MRVAALLLNSVRLDVGRPIIFVAVLVTRVSLAQFLTESMNEKQVEQYSKMGWIMFWYSNNRRWGAT